MPISSANAFTSRAYQYPLSNCSSVIDFDSFGFLAISFFLRNDGTPVASVSPQAERAMGSYQLGHRRKHFLLVALPPFNVVFSWTGRTRSATSCLTGLAKNSSRSSHHELRLNAVALICKVAFILYTLSN